MPLKKKSPEEEKLEKEIMKATKELSNFQKENRRLNLKVLFESRDKWLTDKFEAHMKKEFNYENYLCAKACEDEMSGVELYDTFLGPDAKHEVNTDQSNLKKCLLDGAEQQMDSGVEMKYLFDEEKLHKFLRVECLSNLRDPLARFVDSLAKLYFEDKMEDDLSDEAVEAVKKDFRIK